MKKKQLKTGWGHWDIYLSKFVDKKINCLVLGEEDGVMTSWLLQNVCTSHYSRVFSSYEWNTESEIKFDEKIAKTKKTDQLVKMNINTEKALLKLKNFEYINFEIIFIDASRVKKDVLIDAVLSWDLLVEGGIMIFDEHDFNSYTDNYLTLTVAIDSFIQIFGPQMKILFQGYQYMIEKINNRNENKGDCLGWLPGIIYLEISYQSLYKIIMLIA